MHNAEYDGSTVEAEIIRLKGLIASEFKNTAQVNTEKKPVKEDGLTKRLFNAFFD